MKTSPEMILNELQRVIEGRKEWDELPEISLIYRAGFIVTTEPLQVPASMWDTHPPTVLFGLAQGLTSLDPPPALHAESAVIGVAFRMEAFSIASDNPEPRVQEAVRRRTAGGSIPRFQDIPGRQEQRVIQAVDLEDSMYSVHGNRMPDDTMGPVERFHSALDDETKVMGGSVTFALRLFLRNLLAPAQK